MSTTALQYPTDLTAGDRFGTYEVLAVLSQSPEVTVVAAHDPETNQDVVIKLCSSEDQRPAMHCEAQALRRVQHTNVATLISSGESEAGAYLVLAFVPGKSLTQWLKDNPNPAESDVVSILKGLAHALTAAHTAGYVHRDMKPSNVIIRPDGKPVLIDFSAATPIVDAAATATSDLTPGFAAPEQYELGGQEGPWTDVYGLGAVGYRIVTGSPPPDAAERCANDQILAASDIAHGKYSASLLRTIDTALQLDEMARPGSVDDFRLSLAKRSPIADNQRPGEANPDEAPTRRVQRLPSLRPAPAILTGAAQPRPPREFPRSLRRLGQAAAAAIVLAGIFVTWDQPTREPQDVWVVDPAGLGDATTIAEALLAAPVGATINVLPGEYVETLLLDRPVSVIGTGDEPGARILPALGPCLIGTASHGFVSGLHFGAGGDNGHGACIVLSDGGIALENNTFSDRSGPAIAIRGGARPFIRNNKIGPIDGPGILIEAGATGFIIGNEITATSQAAIVISDGARPTISQNTISETQQAGILFERGSAGLVIDNDILASKASGIEVRDAARPTIRANRIQAGRQAGLYAYAGASGQIIENVITDNAFSGVVLEGASPILRGNEIRDNAEHGMLIMSASEGQVLRNTIIDNGGFGLAVTFGAKPKFEDNQLSGNQDPQTQYGILSDTE